MEVTLINLCDLATIAREKKEVWNINLFTHGILVTPLGTFLLIFNIVSFFIALTYHLQFFFIDGNRSVYEQQVQATKYFLHYVALVISAMLIA